MRPTARTGEAPARWAAAAVLGLCASAAAGHDLGPPAMKAMAWDCWVDTSGWDGRIRCIADLDGTAARDVEPALEHLVLHQLHDMIHGNQQVAELDALLDRSWPVLREGDVWTIRIFRLPDEDSWRERHPQMLVRSLLCPPRSACRVHFKERGQATPWRTAP